MLPIFFKEETACGKILIVSKTEDVHQILM
jgi:hypothetical protein